jgi:hypothetical protein
MAEFEELRLTVNLQDNATPGLAKIRGEIGLLTGSATALTTAVNAASAGVTNLGGATNKAVPGLRNFNTEMRAAAVNANALKDGFARMGVATQGLQSLPQIAGNMRDMGVALHGLGGAFASVGTTAKVALMGIGGVAIAVVGLGAAVVAYGVSVFRFAREMDTLGKTARQMGMTFAELKYAQDEAKRFGQSAESITRSFQAVGDAQFNLSKNNSSLRARLIGMGVDQNWVNKLAAMDPNKARNAVITYGKALERQMIEAGVAKNVARAMMNQWGAEFGLSAEDMEMPILKDPDPKTAKELERIGVLSKQISLVWGEITAIWDEFSTEILAMGLPIVLDALGKLQDELPALLSELKVELKGLIDKLPGFIESIPETLTMIRTELGGVAQLFKDIKGLYDTITGTASGMTETKKDEGVKETPEEEATRRNENALPPSGSPAPPPNMSGPMRSGRLERPPMATQQRYYNRGMEPQPQSYQGGTNDYSSLRTNISFTQDELIDETGRNTTQAEKLTAQLEKLNAFFDRNMDGGKGAPGSSGSSGRSGATGGSGPGSGVQNASYTPEQGGTKGGNSGGGTSGTASGGTSADQQRANSDSADTGTDTGGSKSAPASGAGAGAGGGGGAGAGSGAGGGAGGGMSPAQASAIMTGGNVASLGTVPQTMTKGSGGGGGGGGAPVGVDDSAEGRAAGLAALTGEVKATGAEITSTYRSPNHPLSRANPHSAHSRGLAFDTRARTPEQSDTAMARIRETMGGRGLKEGRDYKIIDEVRHPSHHATGPHVHTQLTPQGMKRYQESKAAEQSKVAGTETGPVVAPAKVGGYPSSLLSAQGAGSGIGLGASLASQPDRGALDRGSLTTNQTVRADGSVKVDVGPSAQQGAEQARTKLFKNTDMQRQEAGQLTQQGPSVAKTTEESYSI